MTLRVARKIRGSDERGYVLLTLLLAMTLLAIAAGIAASSIAFSIRRDREEELIHRGVQYTRAIREFAKKTGQFPLHMDQLDNTNGRRFIRKHYKDPVTGKDFKLVYMIETLRQSPVPPLQPPGNTNGSPGFNGTPHQDADPNAASPSQPGADGDQPDGSSSNPSGTTASGAINSSNNNNPPTTGGLIVGVVSTSTDGTIREFSGKRHYNEWRFYYDPAFDKYFLMNAPTVLPKFQPPPQLDGASSPVQTTPPTPQAQPQPSSQ